MTPRLAAIILFVILTSLACTGRPTSPDKLAALDKILAKSPPPQLANIDFPALLKSLNATFKDDLEAVDCSFARASTGQDNLLLHIQPKRDGLLIVRCDIPDPAQKDHIISIEFHLAIGKKGAPRLASSATKLSPLADVGDTVLLPLPRFSKGAQFFNTIPNRPQKTNPKSKPGEPDNFAKYLTEAAAKAAQQEIEAFAALTKKYPPNKDVNIKNELEADLPILGLKIGRGIHRSLKSATDSITLLLEARRPAEFTLTTNLKIDHPEENRFFDPLPITIIPADKPLTVLAPRAQLFEPTGSSTFEFTLPPRLAPRLTLRVGDRLLLTPWLQVVTLNDPKNPPPISPPPLALKPQ